MALLLVASPWLNVEPPPAAAAAPKPSCSAFTDDAYERVNPTTHTALILRSGAEAGASEDDDGFTSARSPAIRVAGGAGTGLLAVHRMFRATYGASYFYAATPREVQAASAAGYADQGVAFYASAKPAACLVGVRSYYRAGVHRFVVNGPDQAALSASGWKRERVRFYVGRAAADPTFSIAVIPDSQQEVLSDRDGRFVDRSRWLVANRRALDLRFVTHTGDVVNWDTPDHAQYARARSALAPLEAAGIPYSISLGNHDTAAVCTGGGACDPHRTRALVRDTSTANRYLDRGWRDREGSYEPGRMDNNYYVFTAGGIGWLVLNLELWPRPGAVAWAQQVVASHPRHNVIVVTHSYLTASGAISKRAEYGDTSPDRLATLLVKKYPNVRLVLSGHAGKAAHRVDRGVHGNRIDTFLLTMHSLATNPVRLITIDTSAGTLRTWVYGPWTHTTYPRYTVNLRKLRWVR